MKLTVENLIKYFSKYVPFQEIGDAEGITYWKSRLFYIIILGILIFGFIAYVPSIYLCVIEKLWSVAIIDTVVYLFVIIISFSKKIPGKVKVKIILFLSYFLGVALLLLVGPYGAGFIWLFVFPVLAGILLDYRSVIKATTLNAITLVLLGILFLMKKPDGLIIYDYTLMGWVVNSANFIALNFLASLSLSVILSRVDDSLKKEKKLTKMLKLKQQKLKTEKRRAQESDKLKSAFLANMSHEIRTPMNAIIGFAGFLRDPAKNEKQIEKYAGIIIKSGNHLLRLINDIIDISKIDSGQMEINPEPVDLNSLLQELYTFFYSRNRDVHEDNVKIHLIVPEKDIHVLTDETRLRQILINLLSNAVKFTENGSIIFGYKITGDELLFSVKDTGIGIPAQMHELIFKRFRQADKNTPKVYGGTGLGLSIAKACTEMLGGKIWLESEIGKGTTFFFTLPLQEIQTDSKEEKLPDISELDFHNEKILIVEDDSISFQYLDEILSKYSLQIFRTVSGIEAIEFLKKDNRISLVLMDIQLPGMNGWEVTKIIKQLRPELPVIAQTAYAYESDHKRSLEAGCDDYLAKPISKEDLLKVIYRHLR